MLVRHYSQSEDSRETLRNCPLAWGKAITKLLIRGPECKSSDCRQVLGLLVFSSGWSSLCMVFTHTHARTRTYEYMHARTQLDQYQDQGSECLRCTFRASCCSARLSRAQVPIIAGSCVRVKKKKRGDQYQSEIPLYSLENIYCGYVRYCALTIGRNFTLTYETYRTGL